MLRMTRAQRVVLWGGKRHFTADKTLFSLTVNAPYSYALKDTLHHFYIAVLCTGAHPVLQVGTLLESASGKQFNARLVGYIDVGL